MSDLSPPKHPTSKGLIQQQLVIFDTMASELHFLQAEKGTVYGCCTDPLDPKNMADTQFH
jgi:hypothetical protein